MDRHPKGQRTNYRKAMNFLRHFGIKIALQNDFIFEKLPVNGFDISFPSQDVIYLDEQDIKRTGRRSLASANMNELTSTKVFDELFLNDKVYGKFSYDIAVKIISTVSSFQE